MVIVVLSISMTVTVMGCKNEIVDKKEDVTKNSETKQTTTQFIPDDEIYGEYKGECFQSKYGSSNIDIAETEKSLYWVFGEKLYYASKSEKYTMYLCGRPDCEHVNDRGQILTTCNAYIENYLPRSLMQYNNKLYYIKNDTSRYEGVLVSMDLDGSNKEELFSVGKIPDNSSYFSCAWNDNILYTINSSLEFSYVNSFDLSTGESQVIVEQEEGCNYVNLKAYNGSLFFRKNCKDDLNNNSILRYNISDKKLTEYNTGYSVGYTIDWTTDTLLYWVYGDGLYRCNISTGANKKILQADNTTKLCYVMFNGNYIYLDNSITRSKFDRSVKQKIIMVNQQGNIISELKTNNYIQIVCTNDMIVIQDIINEMKFTYADSDLSKFNGWIEFEDLN